MKYLRYDEFAPCKALKDYIKCFWFLESCPGVGESGGILSSMYPDGFMDFVFNFGAPIVLDIGGRNKLVSTGEGVIIGQLKQNLNFMAAGVSFFGVKFYPFGLRTFFKVRVHELTNSVNNFEQIAGGRLRSGFGDKLGDRLSAGDFPGAMAVVESFFIKLMLAGRMNFDIDLIRESIKILDATNGLIKMDEMADHLAVSQRLLEIRFKEIVGISPKYYSSIVRVNKLLPIINDPRNRNILENAIKFGYSDQSHFIREFKKHTGFTPGEFTAHRWELETEKNF